MAPGARADVAAFHGLRGALSAQASIRKYTWFRTGGPAALLFRPEDTADVQAFVSQLDGCMPLMPIGVGSNLLIRDGGLDCAVVQLGKAFSGIQVDGTTLTVGAGALDFGVADAAQKAGLAGLEFLRGIPGTIGGAIAMNAGAYGAEMSDVLVDAQLLLATGQVVTMAKAEFQFSYRHAVLPGRSIVLSCRLEGTPGDPDQIAQRIKEIVTAREESQPLRTRTGGSTFKNPDPEISQGRKAWQLIDEAGCRGLKRGGAQVSEKHCNFLLNTGDATAADLEGLGEDVRQRVLDASGVALEWEIKRIGRAL